MIVIGFFVHHILIYHLVLCVYVGPLHQDCVANDGVRVWLRVQLQDVVRTAGSQTMIRPLDQYCKPLAACVTVNGHQSASCQLVDA